LQQATGRWIARNNSRPLPPALQEGVAGSHRKLPLSLAVVVATQAPPLEDRGDRPAEKLLGRLRETGNGKAQNSSRK
jgi:hypothetical protein